jgi:uncharacterized membrane protein
MLTDKHARGRLSFVVVCLLCGLAFLGIGIGSSHVGSGIVGLAVMVAYAALLITIGRRNESAALLSGRISDERQQQVVIKSSAATGQLLVVVLVAGMIVTSAMDTASASTWTALCALAGVAFIAFTVLFSRRG